jgi:predicted RNA-binding protein
LHSTITYLKWHWIDKSGDKIAVVDVFGNEAAYPTFLTSVDLKDGSLIYKERTFSSLPLANIQRENNFPMAVDPAIFFSFSDGIVLLSRMKDEMPKKYKFSWVELE